MSGKTQTLPASFELLLKLTVGYTQCPSLAAKVQHDDVCIRVFYVQPTPLNTISQKNLEGSFSKCPLRLKE